jgi:hypothetical protein
MPPKKTKAKTAPKARATTTRAKAQPKERVAVQKLRTLADVEPTGSIPKRTGSNATAAKKARTLLEEEFERVLAMKQKLRAEARIGGEEKGREPTRQDEKARNLIASLEGMNRFALKMGLISPAESRELYAAAMKRGLHEGTN